MLNYHKIISSTVETKIAVFKHFLSLGSHNAPFRIPNLYSLSHITMFPGSNFMIHENIKESNQKEIQTLLIPLNGQSMMVDGQETNSLVKNAKHIRSEQKRQFLYIVLSGDQGKIVKQQKNPLVYENEKIRIQNRKYKSQTMKVDKRCLVYTLQGQFKVKSTNAQFNSNTVFYNSRKQSQLQFSEANVYVIQVKQ